ncbi:MAG TPA: superoxide dismutase [Bacteroidales bacterium]|nr:superoxide dismutase [Bacteroidales bacterium]
MAFQLPPLPYGNADLEPHISEQTVNYHYGKHHKTYVDKVNKLTEGTSFEDATLEDIIKKAEGGIFNNGAQVWNHTFYWHSLSPDGGGMPGGKLKEAIDRDFGSFEKFKEEFTASATTLFGSGWTWLVMKGDGKLDIINESNAGNPLRNGMKPLLTCDMWEHAFYLDRQNRKPEYLDAFWKLVNWDAAEKRM